MKRPILLTKAELTKPLNNAIARLDSIQSHMAAHLEKIVFEGFFVLAIASFETSMIDTLRVLLKFIPSKLTKPEITLTKEDILNDSPIDVAIDQYLLSLSYKNVNGIIEVFQEHLSIKINLIERELDILQEGKARRNLLIQNNLRVSKFYEENAGPLKSIQKELSISFDYLTEIILASKAILSKFKSAIEEKYINYTKIKAFKELFYYFFPTPVMKFENEWIVDEDKDAIIAYNSEKSKRGALSGSEQTLFSLWHVHICGLDPNIDKINFGGLSEGNRQKAAYFLSLLDIFKS